MNTRKLLLYLVLNALVSASATLGVLWWWNQRQSPELVITATPSLGEPIFNPPATLTLAPNVYVVQNGDTLGVIAERFNVPLADLMAINQLTDPNVLHIGQALIIPTEGFTPATATAMALPTNRAEPPLPTATRDPNLPLPNLDIREVIEAGQLVSETLVIVNSGGPVDLASWTLRDEAGHLYTFPALTLFEGGAVNVHTAAGQDTVTDLFWGQSGAVWRSGVTALLSDPEGSLRARFVVP